jgi:serine/threonine protein kinase
MSFTSGGTRRWMSPELLDPEMFGILPSEGDRPTRQSDCYALGMVIYEVCICEPMGCCELLTSDILGLVWTPPLRRGPVGYHGCQ